MNQLTAQTISDAILDYRDGESILLIETPFKDAEVPKNTQSKHIGLRITTATTSRKESLCELLAKTLFELESLAFESDDNIDYLEVLRVRAASKAEEATAVEIIEIAEKRIPWVGE